MTYEKRKKTLRTGYTTGTCAAAGAKAAAVMLLTQKKTETIEIATPKGTVLVLQVEDVKIEKNVVSCGIKKDGGDDPDITNGAFIYAAVEKTQEEGIFIDGGIGVGRVTKKGLEQPVGAAAINSVPRRMIKTEVEKIWKKHSGEGGVRVVISIPNGEALAKKTYNPRLGIVGGLSILGTSGIVEPMSEQALIDTIKVEMNMRKATGANYLVITPGNYGEAFLKEQIKISLSKGIKCSNFVGEALDYAALHKWKGVLLVGHIGKFIKLAGGMMNTHSNRGDCRMELMTAHSALCGGTNKTLCALMDCVTTDDAIGVLKEAGLQEKVMESIMKKIEFFVTARVFDEVEIGVIAFSNQYGILGKTTKADMLIKKIGEEE